ncbi:MAG: efflux RND transporter periplasmic adaptor subunit [Thiobacillaceae bacterium]|nr:efflux RND transporter periplasmic adaptor subunit [Thiobacillaceae bacterium]
MSRGSRSMCLGLLWLAALPGWSAEYAGVLDWSQRTELSVPVSGVVEAVHVQSGQVVRAGTPLLRLDLTPFKAQVAEAKAEADRQAEEAADAQRELERARELYARTVTATSELDAARLRHARAEALLRAAQARLERARWQLARAEPLAPFDAIVLERRAEPGMTVAAQCQSPMLVSIARADEILARIQLTPLQATVVRPGARAEVTVAGDTYSGVVRGLSYQAGAEAAYVAEIAIPRKDGQVAGLPARVRLP